MEFTDSDLNELENREAIYLTDVPTRDFSTVWGETESAKPRKNARMRNPRHIAKRPALAFLIQPPASLALQALTTR